MIRTLVAAVILSALAPMVSAQGMIPTAIQVDPQRNAILEPGEIAPVVPTWRNAGAGTVVGGPSLMSLFAGPAGATYSVVDGNGFYPSFPPLSAPQSCTDCYSLRVTANVRPVTHWDATVREQMPGGQKIWTLHVGATFSDVPAASPFYRFVETIVHKDVTGGCTAASYCPAAPTSRQAMAVFLLVSKEPRGYTPPPCAATPAFPDVPVSSPFCPWVEELARRGITAGCGSGYCPEASVSREQMAVFVLRTLDPALNPSACGFPDFADVPATSVFCRWIEELARRGVVTGCGGGNYCPASAVTREQMSVFLTATFGLMLYAP